MVLNLPSPLICFAGYPVGLSQTGDRSELDFWVGRSEQPRFYHQIWRQIVARKLGTSGLQITEYGDPAGLDELRLALAGYLGRSRAYQHGPDYRHRRIAGRDQCDLPVRRSATATTLLTLATVGRRFFRVWAQKIYPIPVDENDIIADLLPRNRSDDQIHY